MSPESSEREAMSWAVLDGLRKPCMIDVCFVCHSAIWKWRDVQWSPTPLLISGFSEVLVIVVMCY